MRSHSKHLRFITATLLLSVASPLFAFTCDFKPLIAQAQTAQDRQAEADRLLEEANSQFSEGQFGNSEGQLRKALESFQQILSRQQILSIYKELGYRRQERDLTFMIGVIYGQLGQYDQSLKYSQQTLAIDQELGNPCQEQDTLFKISSMYGVLGQYDRVLEGLDKILAINRELDEPCDTFLLHDNDISDIYQMLGQPDQALKTLEQRLAFDRKVGDRKQEKLTLFVISRLYQQQHQYEQALAALQKALSIHRELGARSSEQSTLTSEHYILISEDSILIPIGEIYEQQGQYEQALDSYQQALTLSREASNPYGAINSFMKLSRVYQRLGQYEQALESYQQALAAGRSVGNNSFKYIQEPYILMSLSQVYRQLGQDNQAREFYQQALAIGTKPGRGNREPSMRALNAMRALNDWGAVQTKKGQFQEALETFEKALAITRKVSQNLGNICTSAQPNSQNLGIARVYSPKLAQAGSKCGSSMGQGGLEGAETLIFKNLGFVYRKLGQPEKSRESYEQALKRYQQKFARLRENNFSDLTVDELTIPRDIAQLYEILGEDNLAQEFYRQAEKLEFLVQAEVIRTWVSLGDVASGIVLTDDDDSSTPRQSSSSSTLNSMGAIYHQQGNYNQALKFYQQSLAIRKEVGDRIGEGRTLNNLGLLYDNQGQYAKALEFYQQALAIFQTLDNRREEGSLLNNLGGVYTQLGQYEQSLSYYQQALVILREISDYRGEGATLHNIGFTYSQLKKYSQALDFYQKALVTRQRIGHKAGAAVTLNNQGFIYNKLGKYFQALQSLERALALFQEIGDRAGEGNALDSLGTVYKSLDDYDKALGFYQQSLAIQREVSARPGERTTLSNIGSLLEKQNKPELAIAFYKEAVNITEAIRQDLQKLTIEEQKAYTETVADTYRSLADLLLSQGRILEAQQVLELLKVQELRNFTRDTRAGGENSGIATNPNESEILKIHGTLIALGRKIEECQQCAERSKLLDQREVIAKEFEENVRSLEQEIRDRTAKDDTFVDPRKLGGNAEAIVSEPGTVLIYPLVLENKIWILWAAKGGITQSIEVPQVGLKQLSEKVVKFRQLLQNPNSDIAELKATGKQLYDWLLPQSLQKELKDNKIQNLVFSLDRVTRYIPMSAVFDGEKYLIENYNISTIISANLTQTGERLPPGTQNTSVLAAGLSEAKKGFNPLPNVPAELDAIVHQSSTDSQGIYPGLKLLNQSFSRKALRDNLAGHIILHIATHGQFVPNNAYASYLLLGDGEELPIPEIQNMRDLNKIHLVVLSACETALGETGQDGTEITGLSYYFLEKGAKAVMASLWQVNDESTRLLMEQFYSNLVKSTAQSPITKAQALRQAQLSLIGSDRPKGGTFGNRTSTANTNSRSLVAQPRPGAQPSTSKAFGFSHPYYWAPFILIGNSL